MTKSDLLRARADEMKKAIAELREDATINQRLVASIKAAVLSELLPEIADLHDALVISVEPTDPLNDMLREKVRRNHKMRLASQMGDWDAVTRIADEYSSSSTDGSVPGGAD